MRIRFLAIAVVFEFLCFPLVSDFVSFQYQTSPGMFALEHLALSVRAGII
jgi:hypothetical protein